MGEVFVYPSRRLGILSDGVGISSALRAVSHHALACINRDLMIYNFAEIDDIPQQVADDIHATGVIIK